MIVAVGLSGCAGVVAPPPAPGLHLQIAHINDHHSNLEPTRGIELTLDGVPTRVEVGGFARVSSLIRSYARDPAVLKVHAGDAQTGTLYHTVFKGKADAALMNLVCFDTFTLGNHEFDYGDQALSAFLDALGSEAGCATEVLSANVRPLLGTPLLPAPGKAYFKATAIREVKGVKVGIVGITVKGKTVNSSRPLPTTNFLEELDAANEAVAQLRAQGIRHIVLATHFGYQNDLALARRLPEVDVIVGGDSHTLLGPAPLADVGLTPAGPYPTVATNADGAPVCVVQSWEYSKAVGLLDVDFDDQGRVQRCGGKVVVPVGDRFERRDAAGKWSAVSPAVQAALTARLSTGGPVQIVQPDPQADALIAKFKAELGASMGRSLGAAPLALCHVRVPGSNAASGCGPRGSDAAQVVAAAFLDASRRADFAVQNSGGVRVAIPQGDLSYDTAYRVLPFANTLVELTLTGAEVQAALEDAVSFHLDPVNGVRGSDGAHPYAAGLRWALDMSKPKGQRFSQLEVRHRATGAWAPLDKDKRYIVVMNDYIASGRDGYTTLGKVIADRSRWVDTGLYYTQTFIDFVASHQGLLLKQPADQYAHQSVVLPDGTPLR